MPAPAPWASTMAARGWGGACGREETVWVVPSMVMGWVMGQVREEGRRKV